MEYLFSYGTLQDKEVQIAIFGRALKGAPDALAGYRQDWLKITDPYVLKTSGKTHHPIVMHTGEDKDRVVGTVFKLSTEDLIRADEYEVDDYVRKAVKLASGLTAWLYAEV